MSRFHTDQSLPETKRCPSPPWDSVASGGFFYARPNSPVQAEPSTTGNFQPRIFNGNISTGRLQPGNDQVGECREQRAAGDRADPGQENLTHLFPFGLSSARSHPQ